MHRFQDICSHEEMKLVLTAQVPYMYCHLLSCLVYLNNVFLAISCGLTIGSSISEIMSRALSVLCRGGCNAADSTSLLLAYLLGCQLGERGLCGHHISGALEETILQERIAQDLKQRKLPARPILRPILTCIALGGHKPACSA